MTFWRSLFVAASLLAAPISLAHAQTPQTVKAKNVVLVHGAWADGSSWSEVIPILQAAGLNVTAVQNQLDRSPSRSRRPNACWLSRTARPYWSRIPGVAP